MKQLFLALVFCLLLPVAVTPATYDAPVRHINVGKVDVTKYCLNGKLTSSDKVVYRGCIALSRDLIKKHHLKFGDKVIIPGIGVFWFDDWMPPQWKGRVDIHEPNYKKAKDFGRLKNQTLIIVKR